MSDAAAPQPGWYADPENPTAERWWNGSTWSDHKRDSTAGPMVAPAASPAVPILANDGYGFTFGSPPSADVTRPDPYAPVAPAVGSPYVGSPYVAAPYGAPVYGGGTNGLALAGLITSAASWLFLPVIGSIAGIILSAFGLASAKQREAAGNPNTGRGLAMAGLIVGIVVGSLTLIFYVVIFAAVFTTTY